MEYTSEITVNLPRNRVIELIDNPDNLAKWQNGLLSFEHIRGEYGKTGMKSRLAYDMNGRRYQRPLVQALHSTLLLTAGASSRWKV